MPQESFKIKLPQTQNLDSKSPSSQCSSHGDGRFWPSSATWGKELWVITHPPLANCPPLIHPQREQVAFSAFSNPRFLYWLDDWLGEKRSLAPSYTTSSLLLALKEIVLSPSWDSVVPWDHFLSPHMYPCYPQGFYSMASTWNGVA